MVGQERVDRSLTDETATKQLGIQHLAINFGGTLHAPNFTCYQDNCGYFLEKIEDVQEELINTALGEFVCRDDGLVLAEDRHRLFLSPTHPTHADVHHVGGRLERERR